MFKFLLLALLLSIFSDFDCISYFLLLDIVHYEKCEQLTYLPWICFGNINKNHRINMSQVHECIFDIRKLLKVRELLHIFTMAIRL